MKKVWNILGSCIAIFSLLIVVSSCSKVENMQGSRMAGLPNKAKPNVLQCPPGYHWDYTYKECVPDSPACADGYHWDPNAGGCEPDNPPPIQPDTIAVMANVNNPYDYTGENHNEAVQAIFPNIDPSNPNLDSVIEAQVKDYGISNWGYNADSIQKFYDTLSQRWNFPPSQIPELDSLGNDLYNMGNISSEANSYIQQIYSYAEQWLNTDTPAELMYNSFATDLISLEGQIKNDNNITDTERKFLLAGCSVARYSAEYWGNYINNNVLQSSLTQPLLFKHLKRWLKIVLSDVAGGIGGIPHGWKAVVIGFVSSSINEAVRTAD